MKTTYPVMSQACLVIYHVGFERNGYNFKFDFASGWLHGTWISTHNHTQITQLQALFKMVAVISSPFQKQRNLQHRKKNCECLDCFAQMVKAPPFETAEEREKLSREKQHHRKVKKAKIAAKKQVKSGKQATMQSFFGRTKKKRKV